MSKAIAKQPVAHSTCALCLIVAVTEQCDLLTDRPTLT